MDGGGVMVQSNGGAVWAGCFWVKKKQHTSKANTIESRREGERESGREGTEDEVMVMVGGRVRLVEGGRRRGAHPHTHTHTYTHALTCTHVQSHALT